MHEPHRWFKAQGNEKNAVVRIVHAIISTDTDSHYIIFYCKISTTLLIPRSFNA